MLILSVFMLLCNFQGRKSCSNADHGCVQALPPAQLSSHLLVCEFTRLECPAMGCNWHCIAKKLSFHIRDVCFLLLVYITNLLAAM